MVLSHCGDVHLRHCRDMYMQPGSGATGDMSEIRMAPLNERHGYCQWGHSNDKERETSEDKVVRR